MVKCPQYLSAPIQVLFWELDEVLIIFMFFIIAMVFNGWAWLALFIGPYIYGKLRKRYNKGFLIHLMYLSGIKPLKYYPISFQNTFME